MTALFAPADPEPPRPVASVAELVDRQADDARALSGAQTSAWNGKVGWLPRRGRLDPRGVVGIADWDGTLYYDRDYVLRPLQALFGKAAGQLDGRELYRAKNALAVVLHENCHLLGSGPEDHTATRTQWSWPLVVLEEGATELFTQVRLNAYVRRLGLDQRAPGLTAVHTLPAYPLFVPAVQTLTHGVGHLTGRPGSEVLRDIVRQAGGKKFDALAAIVLGGSGVAARMPEDHRPAAVEEIGGSVRNAFGDVARMAPCLGPETCFKLSRRVGREALRGILLELERLDADYPRSLPAGMARGVPNPIPLPPGIAASPARDRWSRRRDAPRRGDPGLTR